MLMMEPPSPCSTMRRAAAWATRKTPLTLTASTLSRFSSDTSRNGSGTFVPALLTRTSICSRNSTASSTWRESVTSQTMDCAFCPVALTSQAVSSNSLRERAMSVRSAPALANAIAHPRPMPRPAPVTIAIRPSKRSDGVCGFASLSGCSSVLLRRLRLVSGVACCLPGYALLSGKARQHATVLGLAFDVVRYPEGYRLDGLCRVVAVVRRKDPAAHEEEVRHLVRAAVAVHHRLIRIVAHDVGAHLV